MASDRSSSQLLQSPPAKLGPVSLLTNWVRPLWRASSRRAPESAKPEAAKAKSLQQGIAEFYDESSGAWEDIWGEHMHHGFYQPGEKSSLSCHRSAQLRMIEEALCFAGVPGSPSFSSTAHSFSLIDRQAKKQQTQSLDISSSSG